MMRFLTAAMAALFGGFGFAVSAHAAGTGQPEPWQMDLQNMVTPTGHNLAAFHTGLVWLITLICIFVLVLLIIVVVKFNAKANPVPSRTTHNTMIEVVWTVVPVLILIGIAIPSFRLLYQQRDLPAIDMTIKATGAQWYWTYDYPDHGDISFDAVMKTEAELKDGEPRLLATDNKVIVPVNKNIRVIVTAGDVLHAWTVPSFGVKVDAVPGRLNELWFRAEKEGIYYGQCSELCGKDHAYMPIEVHVVSEADFNAWVEKTKSAGLEKAYKMLAERRAARGKLAASSKN